MKEGGIIVAASAAILFLSCDRRIALEKNFIMCPAVWHSFSTCVCMPTLFPVEVNLPPGFRYFPDFISNEEEEKLHWEILNISLNPMVFHGFEAKRKVASFGCHWSFTSKTLTKGTEIPETFHPLILRISDQLAIDADKFCELLITEYPVGSVINWHRDAPPFELIAGISLLSDCTLRFRPCDKEIQNRKSIVALPVAPRSLYLISGEARTDWEHSIPAVKQVRYSITVRTLK